MSIRFWYSLLLYCCLFVACQPQVGPEQIVKQYVQALSQGDLTTAKTLCTPAADAYLTALSELMAAAEDEPAPSSIEIRSIKCTVKELDAICETAEFDGFETYPSTYYLHQDADGNWLMDQPTEVGSTSTHEEVITNPADKN